MGLAVDRGYRTMLGTAFYDREAEIEGLGRLLGAHRLVIVYGPRNVGKSELARYYVHRNSGRLGAIVVDARQLRARGLEAVGLAGLRSATDDLRRLLLDKAREAVDAALGFLPVASSIVSRITGFLEGVGRLRPWLSRILILIDEFHELPGYRRRDPEPALSDLESLAALLAKTRARARVLVTVSEGIASSRRAMAALQGYSVGWLLAEHLDPEHFAALHAEYREKEGCRHDAYIILRLVGGAPGWLPDLCPIPPEDILEWKIPSWISILEAALSRARNELGLEPQRLIGEALRVLTQPVRPLEEPERFRLGEILVWENVACLKRSRGGLSYVAQYPVYRVILELAAREGLRSLLDLDPARVLEEALGPASRQGRT